MSQIIRRKWGGTDMFLTSAGGWSREQSEARIFPDGLSSTLGGILTGLTNGQGEFVDLPRETGWVVMDIDGDFFGHDGFEGGNDSGLVLILGEKSCAQAICDALNNNLVPAHVYRDTLEIIE